VRRRLGNSARVDWCTCDTAGAIFLSAVGDERVTSAAPRLAHQKNTRPLELAKCQRLALAFGTPNLNHLGTARTSLPPRACTSPQNNITLITGT